MQEFSPDNKTWLSAQILAHYSVEGGQIYGTETKSAFSRSEFKSSDKF